MSTGGYDVVVLAGDRGPRDPLAAEAGVAGKVLAPVGGRPMLERVLAAVAAARPTARVLVACPDSPDHAALLGDCGVGERVPAASGPAASAARAMARIPDDRAVVLVTGDHPLLRPEWLEVFVESARERGCDAAVGVVDHAEIQRRFPGHRRTHYRFSDVSVCGTNLFYFAGRSGREVVALWHRFEADRKKPWRIVARLGLWNLLRYLSGRLTLAQATRALSARLGARIEAIPIADAEAAVDVDSPVDRAFAEALLAARREPTL